MMMIGRDGEFVRKIRDYFSLGDGAVTTLFINFVIKLFFSFEEEEEEEIPLFICYC